MNIEGKISWLGEASRRKRWLVGVSGGLDSMALLHLMKEAGFRDVVVCHLDHGLRGKASAGDAKFVKRAAEEMGFKVELGKKDVRRMMEDGKESLETAARRARHAFFGECARTHRCWRLLLAHQADDQAETVLWNLVRGSHGCRGMREVSELQMGGRKMEVVRPLLGLRKVELREWIEARRFKWREDASNAECDVVRNRIRNEVLPLLGDISGRDVIVPLARAAETDEGWREVAAWAVERANALDPQGRLHLGVFRDLPVVLRRQVMAAYLKSYGIADLGADLISRCVNLAEVDGASVVNLPGGGWMRRRAGRLFVEAG